MQSLIVESVVSVSALFGGSVIEGKLFAVDVVYFFFGTGVLSF